MHSVAWPPYVMYVVATILLLLLIKLETILVGEWAA